MRDGGRFMTGIDGTEINLEEELPNALNLPIIHKCVNGICENRREWARVFFRRVPDWLVDHVGNGGYERDVHDCQNQQVALNRKSYADYYTPANALNDFEEEDGQFVIDEETEWEVTYWKTYRQINTFGAVPYWIVVRYYFADYVCPPAFDDDEFDEDEEDMGEVVDRPGVRINIILQLIQHIVRPRIVFPRRKCPPCPTCPPPFDEVV